MSDLYEYRIDQELPAMSLAWDDGVGNLLALATGWTPTVKVALAANPTATMLTKTIGITLADTSPNYVIDWAITDWTTITAALAALTPPAPLPKTGTLFVVHAYAKRTGDTKDRVFRPGDPPAMKLLPAPT